MATVYNTTNMYRPSDKLFFWSIVCVLWAVTAGPLLFGWALTPPHYQFYANSFQAPADPSVYYSYIEQGRHGQIMMYDAFTSEPKRAVLFQPLWFIVGLVAQVLHVSSPVAFTLARWAATPVLLLALWWTIEWLWTDKVKRRLAIIVTSFGGGLGGVFYVLAPHWLDFSGRTAPDLWISEAYVFLSAITNVHFLLVTAGLLFALVSVERSFEEKNWWRAVWAGVVLLGVFSIHPFHVVTLVLAWMLISLWRWASDKKFPTHYIGIWLLTLAISSPVLLYYGLQLLSDPLVIGRAVQNVNLMTSPLRTLIGLGVFFPAAILGWRKLRHQKKYVWLTAWALAIMVAVYMPFNFQRRLSQGMIIPFALLSVPVFEGFWVRAIRGGKKQWLYFIIGGWLLFFSPLTVTVTNALSYLIERTGRETYVYYISPEYQDLAAYIKNKAQPNQPILASATSGRVLASLTAHQVFIGYSVETLNFDRKLTELRAWYGTMTQTEQQNMLQRENLCYVLVGPRELAYGSAFHPKQWPSMDLVWLGPTMALYYDRSCPR